MAKANKEVEVVERIVHEENDVIVLVLSPEEAAALKCVLQKIGGNETNSIRSLITPISNALYSVDVKWQPCDEVCEPDAIAIRFKDYTRQYLKY